MIEAPEFTADRRPGRYVTDDGVEVDAFGADDRDGTFWWAPFVGITFGEGEQPRHLEWRRGERERFEPHQA